MINTVLFDLDGTLADTAPDLAAALNRVLLDQGCQPLPFSRIRPEVSNGAAALVRLGFGLEAGEAGFDALRQALLDEYSDHIAAETRLFPGMADVLTGIEQRGMKWGVVTNKPAFLTDPLLAALQVAERAACVVSGDTLPQRKPDPAPMLHACLATGSEPEHCVYVGDAERDIVAGRRAGMRTLAARFGYIGKGIDLSDWRTDAVVDSPLDILAWLEEQGARALG